MREADLGARWRTSHPAFERRGPSGYVASSGWRSDTWAHSSQTDSGMTPARIRAANPMHPRQIPAADSRSAAVREHADQDQGGQVPAGAEPAHEGGGAERRPDRLGEPLGRPGHRAWRAEPGGDQPAPPAAREGSPSGRLRHVPRTRRRSR